MFRRFGSIGADAEAEQDAKRLTNASPLVIPQHSTFAPKCYYVRAPCNTHPRITHPRTHAPRTTHHAHTVIHQSHISELGISTGS